MSYILWVWASVWWHGSTNIASYRGDSPPWKPSRWLRKENADALPPSHLQPSLDKYQSSTYCVPGPGHRVTAESKTGRNFCRCGGEAYSTVGWMPQREKAGKEVGGCSLKYSDQIWYQNVHLKCPSTEEWIKKMWYIPMMGYYWAIKKNEIMLFVATWMQLEIIIYSKSDTYNCHMMSLICGF